VVVAVVVGITQVAQCKAQVVLEEVAVARLEQEHHLLLVRLALLSPSVLNGYAGGSGIVILKYSDAYSISNPGGGLTYSTSTSGGYKITSFTAGTGNIQFA
jgi:hypothetical protein